jgi:hypothetical protein
VRLSGRGGSYVLFASAAGISGNGTNGVSAVWPMNRFVFYRPRRYIKNAVGGIGRNIRVPNPIFVGSHFLCQSIRLSCVRLS